MPVNVRHDLPRMPPLTTFDKHDVKDPFYHNNKVPRPVTYQIGKVDNSKEESFATEGRSDLSGMLAGPCQSLWSPGRTAGEDDGPEVISLTEIICEGEALRLQAESLHTSRNKQSIPGGWKGGLFKRFLVGAGILTGAGVVGYQCYAGPEDIDRQEVNPAQPYPEGPPVDPMMPDCGSAAMLNDAFGNDGLRDNSKSDGVRHSRRQVPQSSAPKKNYLAERQLMENQFIKRKSDLFIFEIIARDLSALKEINERHFDYLKLVISNTVKIVDSAITLLLKSSNRDNNIRPVMDDYTGMVLLSHLYADVENMHPSEHKNFLEENHLFKEQIEDELVQPFIVDINQDSVFINRLMVNLAKMRNYLERGCDRYNNNCLNFIYANKNKDTEIYEKENALSPLIATVGDQILPKIGYDKLNIILTEDFFKLCTVDASNIIIHELAHYFTDTTDLFEIKREPICEQLPATALNHSCIVDQLSFAEDRLSHLKDDIESYISNRWDNISIQIKDILVHIPNYPADGNQTEQINVFLEYYRNYSRFRKDINYRATDYYSNLIIALASQQFKHDGEVTLSAVENLKDS